MSKKIYLLILVSSLISVMFFSNCTKEGPMGPMGPMGPTGPSGTVTNYIFYGSGSVIGGTVKFNPGIVGKGCKVRIEISAAYSIFNISSSNLNWVRGSLSSNVYYFVEVWGETPKGLLFFSIETNLYSPSVGNVINVPNTEVYDYDKEWQIPNQELYVSDLKCDSSGNVISLEMDEYYSPNILVIRKYNNSGSFLATLVVSNDYSGSWVNDFNFTLDSSDNIYLCYRSNSVCKVEKFNNSGNPIGSTNLNEISKPCGIAIDSSGNVFISDGQSFRIYKYDSNFNFITSFGGKGTGNGKFSENSSLDLVCDSSGNIFVSDGGNKLIQKFDNDGTFIEQFEAVGFGKLDMDLNNYIYTASGMGMIKYSSSGNYVTELGMYASFMAVNKTGAYFYGSGYHSRVITKCNKL